MTRVRNASAGATIHVRTSAEVAGYLEDLSVIGIHGKTKSEVAKTLIGQGVENLIKAGLLSVRHPGTARPEP